MKIVYTFFALCFLTHNAVCQPEPLLVLESAGQFFDFSPDGEMIFAGDTSNESALRIWDAESGQLVNTLRYRESESARNILNGFDIADDGSKIIFAAVSKFADIWDLSIESIVTRLGPHEFDDRLSYWETISTVDLSPDSQYAIVGYRPGGSEGFKSVLWDTESKTRVDELSGWFQFITAKSQQYLVNDLTLYDFETRQPVRRYVSEQADGFDTVSGRAIDVSDDGSFIVFREVAESLPLHMNHPEFFISVFKFDTGELLHQFVVETRFAEGDISPDGKWLVAGSILGDLWIWDLERSELVVSFRDSELFNETEHNAGKFSPDGRFLLTRGGGNDVLLWSVDELVGQSGQSGVDRFEGYK